MAINRSEAQFCASEVCKRVKDGKCTGSADKYNDCLKKKKRLFESSMEMLEEIFYRQNNSNTSN